jgi:hypothetical protein
LSPEQSKDIAVGTVQQIVKQGEIPLEDHIQILREEESIFFGVLLDYIIHFWDEERAVKTMGPEGVIKIRRLKGAAIPNVDVVITATPRLAQIKIEELQALMFWLTLEPPARLIAAQLMNIPISFVRKYQAELDRFNKSNPAANGAPGAGPSGNGKKAQGPPTGPPGASRLPAVT